MQYENNVDNTQTFSLLLSSAYRKPRTSWPLLFCQTSHAQRSCEEAQPGKLTQTCQSDVPYHRLSWPLYKLGELAERCQLLLRDGLGSSQQMVNNYIVHHFFFLGFLLPSPSPFPFYYNYYYHHNILLGFVLNCSYPSHDFTSFFPLPDCPPQPTGSVWGLSKCGA